MFLTLNIYMWCGVLKTKVVPYNQADCPYPLKYNTDQEDSFAESNYDFSEICVYPCPSPMWTEAEWIGTFIADAHIGLKT